MHRLLPALFVLLLLPAQALARAGGGSSGFGGGGGGGGSSGGGGSGGSGGLSWPEVLGVVILATIFFGYGALMTWRVTKRRRKRVALTVTASAEAAEDDRWFAAGAIKKEGTKLFCDVQAAWDANDRAGLRRLVGPDLLVEWERRLDDFDRKGWHNRVEVRGVPDVEYVGLVNREDDDEDRVCVRLTGSLFDVVETADGKRIKRSDAETDTSSFAEFWTLTRHDGHWMVLSIEQDEEGQHNLEEPLVPTPWSDSARLHDEAVIEQAQAGAANGDAARLFSVAFADDARKAALDLSLVDDRYAPDVLEVAARKAVEAWAEAVDGDDAALEAVAEPEAIRRMLFGDDATAKTRLVVRGPHLEDVRILKLDSQARPPSFTVEARVRGRRYVEDRDTVACISGDPDHETTFTERWKLVLSEMNGTPWRIGNTA
jgi:predicted lipid-binding transport protein (Tim44 family)